MRIVVMSNDARLLDIKNNPSKHHHTFDGRTQCCLVNGCIDSELLDVHGKYAPLGTNGGIACDVIEGPCACGGWH